jgi:hypothetical protein
MAIVQVIYQKQRNRVRLWFIGEDTEKHLIRDTPKEGFTWWVEAERMIRRSSHSGFYSAYSRGE